MNIYPHPLIAREGWPFIAISLIISILASHYLGGLIALPLWLITLFVVQFFRDPGRVPPQGDHLVIAPADGRIVAVEHIEDPWLKREALKVSVFMNVFNVHSNRSPIEGRVEQRWYHPGRFVNAALAKASVENERCALWIKTTSGQDITCVQIAGLVARRILCYVDQGDALKPGQRYGFIRFGSRVDVYLPLSATTQVAIGDKVTAGHTVLAELAV